MLNLFAYRATDPHVLKSVADPVGPDNGRHLLEVCRQAALVVCCWGADGEYRGFRTVRSLKCCGVSPCTRWRPPNWATPATRFT
jgi:hypothetical protein